MRIAQIAPLIESVPPRLYGGTERVVSYLSEELVRQGHQVTLFASGDSLSTAELVPCAERALRLESTVRDPLPYYMVMLDRVRRRAAEFDVIHFHIDYLHFPLFRQIAGRTLTTQHGRLDLLGIVMAADARRQRRTHLDVALVERRSHVVAELQIAAALNVLQPSRFP